MPLDQKNNMKDSSDDSTAPPRRNSGNSTMTEQAFIAEYVRLTGATESAARCVYMLRDAATGQSDEHWRN